MITARYCSNTDLDEKSQSAVVNNIPVTSFPSVLANRIGSNHGIRRVCWKNIPFIVNFQENQPA
jgi:hypothetical protein